MRVQFWGTRGSIAKPGPSTARYGGNTSCIEVRSARGTLVIIDCGTGGHSLGQKLKSDRKLTSAERKGLRGHILISHTHWDHIQGIPFFDPLFAPGNEWDIYGPNGLSRSFREILAAQMQHNYFPVTLDQCGAKIRYHELVEGSFDIDDIKVSTRYLNHPALTLGYRLESDGVTVVYACDHEPHSRLAATGDGEITGQDLRHAEFVSRADLLIHDAQYSAEEYPAKIGWGHSSAEYAVNLGRFAQVKRIALTHHDPLRDDDAIDRLVASIRGKLRQSSSSLEVFAAFEGQIVDVAADPAKGSTRRVSEFPAEIPVEPALARQPVLLGVADTRTSAALCEAVRAEGICVKTFSNIAEARKLIAKDRPSLVILEHDPPRINGMDMCRAIRRQANGHEHRLPIVLVSGQEDCESGDAAAVTDWLIKPFTGAYARTKIRAWVLRTACRWIPSGAPANEGRQLASPLVTRNQDLEPDNRFDRITGPQHERRRSPKRVAKSDKSALLWMYSRKIAPFESPTFSSRLSEIIARAASAPEKG